MKITQLVAGILLALFLSHAVHGAEEAAAQFDTAEDAIAAITQIGKSKFGCPFDKCNTTCPDSSATVLHIHSAKHFGTHERCMYCGRKLAYSTVRRSPHKNGSCLN